MADKELSTEAKVTLTKGILGILASYSSNGFDGMYHVWTEGEGEDKVTTVTAYANWNIGFPKEEDRYRAGRKATDILEKYGIEVEWSDEVTTCDGCGRLIRTQPDSYFWQPGYAVIEEEGILCTECIVEDPESLIEEYLNDAGKCIDMAEFKPEKYGFSKFSGPHDTGWHNDMNADPEKESAKVDSEKYDFIMVKDENSQFYIRWSVWVRLIESEEDGEE